MLDNGIKKTIVDLMLSVGMVKTFGAFPLKLTHAALRKSAIENE